MAEFYSEYYKQPASGDWTKLLSGRMSTELEWAKLFGLTMNGTDDGRQIFDPIGLRDVFRAFANKPSGFDNGAVATVVVRTVRNARRGIEGGKKVGGGGAISIVMCPFVGLLRVMDAQLLRPATKSLI